VGEPADNCICPAIINAIRDAVGVSFFTTLVKPQDVLQALQAQK
jgi:CO/xanthine dehydrogenase Mo-binding subunit